MNAWAAQAIRRGGAMPRHAIASGRVTEGSEVIVATAGAVAVATAHFARSLGLRCTALVPAKADASVLDRIEREGGRWQRAEGPPAGLRQEARALAQRWGAHLLDHVTDAEPAVAAWPPTIASAARAAAVDRRRRRHGCHVLGDRPVHPHEGPADEARPGRPGELGVLPGVGDRRARLRHRHAVPHPRHRPTTRRARLPARRGGLAI